jgi:hypothetical protein
LEQVLPAQSFAVPQVPVASQVWTPLPEHFVSPGLQTPTHAPWTHAWAVQAFAAPHVPFVSQV